MMMMMMIVIMWPLPSQKVAPPLDKLDFPLRGGLAHRVKWTSPSVKGYLSLISRPSPRKSTLPSERSTFPS